MSRSNFGLWGAELDEESFAQALAALGVLVACNEVFPPWGDLDQLKRDLESARDSVRQGDEVMPLPWRLGVEPDEFMRFQKPPDARSLSQAWDETFGHFIWDPRGPRPRLEIQPDSEGQSILPWLVSELWGRVANLRSVYMRIEPRHALSRWDWPLRVGTLTEADARQLRDRLRQTYDQWGLNLCSVEVAGTSAEPSNVLVLPLPLREGLGELIRRAQRARASCVLVLGGIDEPWERAQPLVQALLSETNASAVCIASVPRDWDAWFTEKMLRQLSHDLPLDVALHEAWDRDPGPAPLLFASSSLVTDARVSANFRDLIRHLRSLPPATEIPVPEYWHKHGIAKPEEKSLSAEGLANRLEMILSSLGYGQEIAGASVVAAAGPNIREHAPENEGALRWIQGQVYELREGDPQPARRALRAGAHHVLVARIGPADTEWLTPAPDAVFPDHELDWTVDEHQLQVVFSEPNHAPEPQTATIRLPREGASTTCQFVFQTRTDVPSFRGRVTVLHQNRVLQTALLEGQVVPDPAELPDGPPLTLSIEGTVRPVEDLESHRPFSVALVLNHDATGVPTTTAIADGKAQMIHTDKFQDTVDRIKAKLNEMAETIVRDGTLYATTDAAETVQFLRYLALHGKVLYEGLVRDWGLTLPEAGRIQVVAMDFDRFLPVEFFYDRPEPADDAKLCLHTLEAWRDGHDCRATCPEPGSSVICPRGFWGLRYVIERHTFDPSKDRGQVGDYQLIPESPVAGRQRLNPLHSAVFAASKKVDITGQPLRDAVMKTLADLIGPQVGRAETWDEWKDRVREIKPSLLMLLPHTFLDDMDMAAMEIGDNAQIKALTIGKETATEYVRPSESLPPPIVFLLGCETGAKDVSLDNFVAPFRRAKAALVVTTLSKVLGRHAAPVAKRDPGVAHRPGDERTG